MSRVSGDEYDGDGLLFNGYSYTHQAWVREGRYEDCGHPEGKDCGCYGRAHKGEYTLITRFDNGEAAEVAVARMYA